LALNQHFSKSKKPPVAGCGDTKNQNSQQTAKAGSGKAENARKQE